MQEKTVLVLAVMLFGYIAANGVYMLSSPSAWAEAVWTAKGMYRDPELRIELRSGKKRRGGRITGFLMLLLSAFGLLTILSLYS